MNFVSVYIWRKGSQIFARFFLSSKLKCYGKKDTSFFSILYSNLVLMVESVQLTTCLCCLYDCNITYDVMLLKSGMKSYFIFPNNPNVLLFVKAPVQSQLPTCLIVHCTQLLHGFLCSFILLRPEGILINCCVFFILNFVHQNQYIKKIHINFSIPKIPTLFF